MHRWLPNKSASASSANTDRLRLSSFLFLFARNNTCSCDVCRRSRDKFVLNPAAKSAAHLRLYRFLGRLSTIVGRFVCLWLACRYYLQTINLTTSLAMLVGVAMISKSPLALDLPPVITVRSRNALTGLTIIYWQHNSCSGRSSLVTRRLSTICATSTTSAVRYLCNADCRYYEFLCLRLHSAWTAFARRKRTA